MAARKGQIVRIESEQLDRALAVMPRMMNKHAKIALDDAGRIFVNAMVKSFRPRGSPSDQWLQNRSNTLRQSIGKQVTGTTIQDLSLSVFSAGVVYANLQEYGGIIKPKPPRKYLTIPMPDNLTPAGVARYPSAARLRDQLAQPLVAGHAGQRRNKRGQLSNDKLRGARTFVLKSPRTGKLYILLRQSNGKTLWLWRLVESVRIPPRFGFNRTWLAQRGKRDFLFARAAERAIVEAFQGATK